MEPFLIILVYLALIILNLITFISTLLNFENTLRKKITLFGSLALIIASYILILFVLGAIEIIYLEPA